MKTRITSLAAALLLSGFCLTSCESKQEDARDDLKDAQENVVDAQNDLNRANAEYEAEIENYRATMYERIDANDRTIEELRAEMRGQKREVKKEYREAIDELQERNRKMKARMGEYKADGKDKWEAFKAEFNHDMEELGNSIRNIGKDNV